ncbi:MAG: hypothetical protein QM714_11500 [Nocardioides sp.]|uniref:hypothetical protein n=1 Tax=Nocardioides sp. TaxID=35761 RepID=UPI0039E5FF3D
MRLADLVDQMELPETRVAEGAWDAARRRTRRRRTAVAGAATVVMLVAAMSALSLRGGAGSTPPTGPAHTPTSSPPDDAPRTDAAGMTGIDHAHTQRLLTRAWWAGLDTVPRLDPGATTELAEDPMTEGVFATVDPDNEAVPIVLGADGQWRRIDLPGLVPIDDGGGYTSPVIRPTAFSPDGTRLALPQPDSLVVVDLTDGSRRTYPMPAAFLAYAVWVDDTHVWVAAETDTAGTVVDLDSGHQSPSSLGPSTAYVDGDTLSWGRNGGSLDWGARPDVPTLGNNDGGLFPYPPLVRAGVVVGDMAVNRRMVGTEDPSLGNGVVAVDATTGDVLAFLPTGQGVDLEVLLGWQGDLPVLGLRDDTGKYPSTVIAAWDYRTGHLEPLAQTDSHAIAWRREVN